MPTTTLHDLLARRPDRPLVLDGGTGTVLEDRGIDVRGELWSSVALLSKSGRDATRRLHEDYVDAGADILIANTHNLNPDSCRAVAEAESDPTELLHRLERLGVELAREAVPADRDVVIAAGIGSAEPWATSTSRSEAQIRSWLAPCVTALQPTGALIVFESLSTEPELNAVARLARDTRLAAFGIGLTCAPGGRTWGGVAMEQVARTFAETGVSAVFVQCTRHDVALDALRPLVAALEPTGTVAGVYANDGRKWADHRWHGERTSAEAYSRDALAWRDAGARIIGGCCGTSPEHIAAIVAAFGDR